MSNLALMAWNRHNWVPGHCNLCLRTEAFSLWIFFGYSECSQSSVNLQCLGDRNMWTRTRKAGAQMTLGVEIALAVVLSVLAAIAVEWWRKPPGKSGSRGFKFTVELENK